MMKKLTLIISLLSGLFLVGCSQQIETITDTNTKLEVPRVEKISSDMLVIHYMSDGMERGNDGFFNKDVVIDTKYYQNNQLKRGDVIVLKNKDYQQGKNLNTGKGYDILRVVALPGEKVKIEKAQIYIDGKKLDTFYGSFHRMGMNLDQYLESRKKSNQPSDQGRTEKEIREEWETGSDYEEETVPDGYVFVVGDDWFRSGSFMISQDNIIGKVLGQVDETKREPADSEVQTFQQNMKMTIAYEKNGVQQLFGTNYIETTDSMDDSELWRYDLVAKEGYTFKPEMGDTGDIEGIKNDLMQMQLFINWNKENRAESYSLLYKGKDGNVYNYRLDTNGTEEKYEQLTR